MFQWCIAYHLTLQFQWTLSLSGLRYDLRSVYISVSFGQDSRLDYQEYYGRTRDTISCKYKSWASFFAPSGISIFPAVFMHLLQPILQKRLFAQGDASRSMWSNIKCRFLAIRAFATYAAITEVIKPLLLRAN